MTSSASSVLISAANHRAAARTAPTPARGEWVLDGDLDGLNLDGFVCPDELREHGEEMREKGAPAAYVEYCVQKARAMEFRAKGWANTVRVIERNCEKLYREIPTAWQW